MSSEDRRCRRAVLAIGLSLVATLAIGCGKKGPVRPPPSKISAPIEDLRGAQLGPEVAMRMTYPTATLGGLPLEGLESLEVWKMDIPYLVFPTREEPEAQDEDDADNSAADSEDGDSPDPEPEEPEPEPDDEVPTDETGEDEENESDRASDDVRDDAQDSEGESDDDELEAEPIRDPLPAIDASTFESGGVMIVELRDEDLRRATIGSEIVLSFAVPEPASFEELQPEEEPEPKEEPEPEPEEEPEPDDEEADPELEPLPPIRKVMTALAIRTRAPGRKPSPFSNIVRIVFLEPPEPPWDVALEAQQTAITVTWEADLPEEESDDESDAEPEPSTEAAAAQDTREADEVTSEDSAGDEPLMDDEDLVEAVPELVGFNVYRRPAGNSDWGVPIGQVRSMTTTYSDRTAEYGNHYEYTVTTVIEDDTEVESEAAPISEIDYVDAFAPRAPGGVVVLTETTRIRLLWNRVDADDLAGYMVYRKLQEATPASEPPPEEVEDVAAETEDGEEDDEQIEAGATEDLPEVDKGEALTDEPIVQLDFSDDTIEPDQAYEYRVTAVDEEGNESSPSSPVTAETR